jgi:hypothetical protein
MLLIILEDVCKWKLKNLRELYQKYVQSKEGHSGVYDGKFPNP